MRFDFHLHTTYSDGTLAPAQLLAEIKAREIKIFAITDHDSMRVHINPNGNEPKGDSLAMIPGVEINTNAMGESLHILGYGRGLADNQPFQEKLRSFREGRRKRAGLFVEKLRFLGFDITMEEVEAHAQETIGRPTIADTLRDKGVVKNREEAFARFLLKGKPAYVPPLGPDPRQAIETIVSAGGVAVLAHPGVARMDDDKLADLVGFGLGGIEAYYPMHRDSQVRDYLAAARQYDLLVTCGSDFHGPRSGRDEWRAFDFEERMFEKFLKVVG